MDKTKENDAQKIKTKFKVSDLASLAGSVPVLAAGAAIGGPIGIAVALPGALAAGIYTANKAKYKVKTNLMGIEKDNTISQTVSILKGAMAQNQKDFFTMECMSLILNMQSGEEYTTCSQSLVKAVLRQAQKEGYIKNLETPIAGKASLFFEKLSMGRASFKDIMKKHTFYNMSFERTDKSITESELLAKIQDKDMYNINTDEQGNVTDIKYNTRYNYMTAISNFVQKAKSRLLPKSADKTLLAENTEQDKSTMIDTNSLSAELSRQVNSFDQQTLTTEKSENVQKNIESPDDIIV